MSEKEALLEEAIIEEEIVEEEEEETFMSDEEYAKQHGDEEIFAEGPTFNQVADWKSRFNGEVYMSDFASDTFIWRPIRRNEYKKLQRVEGKADSFYQEEAMCRTCVLWPEDYANHDMSFGKAGVPSMLADLILEYSGFSRPRSIRL